MCPSGLRLIPFEGSLTVWLRDVSRMKLMVRGWALDKIEVGLVEVV